MYYQRHALVNLKLGPFIAVNGMTKIGLDLTAVALYMHSCHAGNSSRLSKKSILGHQKACFKHAFRAQQLRMTVLPNPHWRWINWTIDFRTGKWREGPGQPHGWTRLSRNDAATQIPRLLSHFSPKNLWFNCERPRQNNEKKELTSPEKARGPNQRRLYLWNVEKNGR